METIINKELSESIVENFLPYANSVIEDRALPDIRDGLKPVQRRIIYGCNDLNLNNKSKHIKCAKVVGQVLGSYHAHGDTSIYGTLVNLAQDFNTRYPLIDGDGNFGSIDGDSAAAYRYTNCRLSIFGDHLLNNINKNTVDFCPNFDNTTIEPTVLPGIFPNLLANGSIGIAVGFATNIPSHNATELYNACIKIIEDALLGQDTSVEDLIEIIPGPDFPTGGIVVNKEAIINYYTTGKGRLIVRSRYQTEDNSLIITEIPYKVNKSNLVASIYELRDELSIKEVRDESKDDIRIVIDFKKDANIQWSINKLLKSTELETSFSVNLLALKDKKPKEFTMKEALNEFIEHVSDTISRRYAYDLEKAIHKKELIEGYLIILDVLEEVIKKVRSSETYEDCLNMLINDFRLTKNQANAVAEMKIRSLTKLSGNNLKQELEELNSNIQFYQSILNDSGILLEEVKKELIDAKNSLKHDTRKTEIANIYCSNSIHKKELIKDENLVITITNNGIIKSTREEEYTANKNRGGKGNKLASVKDGDFIKFSFFSNSKEDLLIFTNKGNCYKLSVCELPIQDRVATGKYINNFIQMNNSYHEEKIVNIVSIKDSDNSSIFLVTKNAIGKRIDLPSLRRARSHSVIKLLDGDELISSCLINHHDQLLIITANGKGIRLYPDSENINQRVRVMGRNSIGVKLAKLKNNDTIKSVIVFDDDNKDYVIVSENGLAKRTAILTFPISSRHSSGNSAYKVTKNTGNVAAAILADDDKEDKDILVITKNGIINRVSMAKITLSSGRKTSGSRFIKLSEGDKVVSVTAADKQCIQEVQNK